MEQRKLYIADLHLFHKNVTSAGRNFDNRPYASIEEMNEDILKRWNGAVNNSDHVYVLGDFIWKFNSQNRDDIKSILDNLNGNIHLIIGNHDNIDLSHYKKRFEEIVHYKKITDILNGKKKHVVLSHYYIPFYEGHYHENILLHGHSHNTKEADCERGITSYLNANGFPANIYNVGCMYPYMDYTPKTLEQIVNGYKEWEENGFK